MGRLQSKKTLNVMGSISIYQTRLSYYNVTTRLVVSWFVLVEKKCSGKNMLGKVLIVDLDYFLVGVCWLKQNLSQTIC